MIYRSVVFKWGALVLAGLLGTLQLGVAVTAQPGTRQPIELVKLVVNNVIEDMKENEQVYKTDKAALHTMVESRIAPYLNFDTIARLVLTSSWETASEQQRQDFRDAFRQQLILTYSDYLFNYKDYEVAVESERSLSDTRHVVNVRVSRPADSPIMLVARFELGEQGWQMIDMVVEGVSLIVTFRSSFSGEIQSLGLDGVIARMRAENQSAQETI